MVADRIFPVALRWGEWELVWRTRTFVMAILNATPDSFSGDGFGDALDLAVEQALTAERDGADILDVGGESTRPGHEPVSAVDEIGRVVPVIAAIRDAGCRLPISIDTSKAAVADAALAAGASLINDVRGFTADPEIARVAASAGTPVVLMHDVAPESNDDLVLSIVRELNRRVERAIRSGVARNNIVVDPGFGFGKDWRQNLELLRRLHELSVLELPVLVGLSRKSTIGRVLGLPPSECLEGTLATTGLAIAGGADIVRVHDVRPNVRAARMTDAVVRGAPAEAKEW